MATTVGEDLPNQIARVRQIQRSAVEIGPSGAFLVAITEASLRAADKATAEQDVVAMVAAYQDLASYKE